MTETQETFLTKSPELTALQALVDDFVGGKDSVSVLEAGCGSTSYVTMGLRARVTGLDISAKQLERHPELDERILGDVETYPLERDHFDLIVCWDVLEHLRHPRRAVANLACSLGPGGLLVLALPNVLSLKGLITKFTPHAFHVWVYRRLFGWPDAGTDDRGPFRTFLRFEAAPEPMQRFAGEHGLAVDLFAAYESWSQQELRRRFRLTGRAWRTVRGAVAGLTAGRVTPELTDYILVLRKP